MKKSITLSVMLFFFCAASALGQDIGIQSITTPVSGCTLSSTENVTVVIKNYEASPFVSVFDAVYIMNGGSPVTESIATNIPANGTITHTFSVQADLSAVGTYTFDAYTDYGLDVNKANDTLKGYIVSCYAPSAGGSVAGDTTVCSGSNSGTVTLSGHTGNILNWEFSTDGGSTWTTITNTTATQNYNNLTMQTMYRAVVKNGTCSPANSSSTTISIDPLSVGGTVSGDATVCSGSNSGTLTLSGQTGTILNWEYSVDTGATWTTIANTTTTQNYLNLTMTTLYRYRAIVQSGSCLQATSSFATITVDPVSVGGTVSGSATVCSGSNIGTVTLSGHTGSVLNWEFSTDGGFTWANISNTATTQNYLNLTTATLFRAIVKSGVCSSTNSSSAAITIDPASAGGTVAGSVTVCSGSNSGTLTLSGHTGNVLNWEFSTDGGSTWTNIANTNTAQNYLNLTATTLYRAVIKSGTCNSANSSSAIITVDPASVGGSVSGSASVCSGSNSGTVTLSGHTGNILNWEYSTDGGSIWTNIANTTTAQNYLNLTVETMYRAVVKNGVCSQTNSSPAAISIDPLSAGGNVSGSATECSGNNSGTLTLSGYTGSILNWQYSTDGGNTWANISNTATTQNYLNLSITTMYLAQVKSGSCSQTNSSPATIIVDTASVGGTVAGSATECSGSNNGTLTLSGYSGNILNWEYSIDGGNTWSSIANTTATQNYLNLTATTMYRAVVQSGVCVPANSSAATITVNPSSVGGTVSGSASVCSGSNSGTLTLNGYSGTILNWEYSTDGGSTWTNIANTTVTQNYLNLTATTMYRVVVQYGTCPIANSSSATVTVTPSPTGGTLSGIATVCGTSNSGTVSLSGYNGNIINWDYSIDGGITWITIANTTTTQNYFNLTTSTTYRALVQIGGCTAYSSIATITVSPATVGGSVSGSTSACSGSNSGTLTLGGHTGSVVRWERSTDGGGTWINISNTTATQNYLNVAMTTIYRAVIQSGVCPQENSSPASITIDMLSVGGTLDGSASVCTGINNGSITLNGNTGSVLQWEYSTDGGVTWPNIINTNTTNNYLNLTETTWYRTIVQNGMCPADTSSTAVITVFPNPTADAGSDVTISLGHDAVLTGTGGVNYSWYPSSGILNSSSPTAIAAPTATTTYSLTVTDANGCKDDDEITITVISDYNFTITNLITPNGDGKNDVWYIDNIENYPVCEVAVFNIYGKELFRASPYTNDWDGSYNGKELPDGTYYYVFKCPGSDKDLKGGITVLRNKSK